VAARKLSAQKAINPIEGYDSIVSELSDLIESARRVSARSVNAVMTATYWEIGRRIVERRLQIGDEWYRVDLLFFHRMLRSLVVIELKLGRFTHADVGETQLYLNYAKEHWVHEGVCTDLLRRLLDMPVNKEVEQPRPDELTA
jgi:hypothetical protein